MATITRRRALAALGPLLGAGAASRLLPGDAAAQDRSAAPHGNHGSEAYANGSLQHAGFRSAGGHVDHQRNGFHPSVLVRDFDEGKTRRLASGRTLREWELVAYEKEIEVAPGVAFAAWTYNGRVPGPTLRAREGERLRIAFRNASQHPHTIHFHGIHPAEMDGVPGIGAGLIEPGGSTVYEFDAEPFGLHLYHCHAAPLAAHITKGLYGAFIVDPKDGRPEADELVMVMNGFDTNFDRSNEVYAANSIPFAYMDEPIAVPRDELVRLYLVNVLEYDLINSFHIHGNVFNYFPTGTSLQPSELTDTVVQCQGQRGIIEMRFPSTGKFMFHAHQSEFTELGWMGFFEVCEKGDGRLVCDLPGSP
ncbi:MAG TPA: multicopper oxidase domain-containing protein [Solirubrobacteraceae bacterium]|nr:multicopper oxidase domain-containing protein [Solirubrobacteraceae bacterium]